VILPLAQRRYYSQLFLFEAKLQQKLKGVQRAIATLNGALQLFRILFQITRTFECVISALPK
jgi:hypothetical protein